MILRALLALTAKFFHLFLRQVLNPDEGVLRRA
jgi:hypothetical protein